MTARSPIRFTASSASSCEPSKPADRKSTRLNSSHSQISYAVFCLKKKKICDGADAIHLPVHRRFKVDLHADIADASDEPGSLSIVEPENHGLEQRIACA